MRIWLILVAAITGTLSACGQTVTGEADAQTQSRDAHRASASDEANSLKLKTGEWLDDSTYGFVQPLGREKEALLTVAFRSPAEPGLREQSLQELVSQRLLTAAMRDGHQKARLWVKSSKFALGPFNASSNEEWMFERADGWQWRQTAGPTIDWSLVVQNLVPRPTLRLEVAQKFIQKRWDSGVYRLEMHTVAFPDLSPKEAMKSLTQLLANSTACDLHASRQPAFLSDDALNAVVVYAYASQKRDLLDIVPNVHFDLGRTDGRWTCNRESMLEAVDKMDWSDLNTWDDLVR